jgi:hypothetical protein
MSPGFTDSQLKAIVAVGWGNGVPSTVLAEFLKIKLPNCITKIVKPLTEMGIFYYGIPIKTSKRGRPRRLLHLKNNPYLLGNIRSELDNRIRAYGAKMEENSRSYHWHRNKMQTDVYKRKMTPEEEIEHYRQSGFLQERISIDKEYSEWHKLLKLFVQGSTYKKTEGIPTGNLEQNFIYDPSYSTGTDDTDFAEYYKIVIGN